MYVLRMDGLHVVELLARVYESLERRGAAAT